MKTIYKCEVCGRDDFKDEAECLKHEAECRKPGNMLKRIKELEKKVAALEAELRLREESRGIPNIPVLPFPVVPATPPPYPCDPFRVNCGGYKASDKSSD